MATGRFKDTRLMMPALFSSYGIGVMAGCREHPLPAPLLPCVWLFALKCIGQSNSSKFLLEVFVVLTLHRLQMSKERFLYCCSSSGTPYFSWSVSRQNCML